MSIAPVSPIRLFASRPLRVAALAVLLLAVAAPIWLAPQGARAASAVTTSDLNLRRNARLNQRVLRVMPPGATVEVIGGPSNGFYQVVYDGTTGWAYGDYLDFSGGGVTGGGASGDATIASALNLRNGPSTGAGIILVMPGGASVTLTGEESDGFLGLVYQGVRGWGYGQYIQAGGGTSGGGGNGSVDPGSGNAGSATVGSALNLRSGPGTDYAIQAVMPGGAAVTLTGANQNGFAGVIYNGQPGWAYAAYLTTGGTSGGGTSGGGGGDVVSIIYSAAAAYGQSGDDLLRVARCESGLDPGAYNASSAASGLFQFLPGTWATTPYAGYNIFDAWANANAAAWMWSVGRRGEWVCQ